LAKLIEHAPFGQRKRRAQQAVAQQADLARVEAIELAHARDPGRIGGHGRLGGNTIVD
jgi:hypothetical protein